MTIFRLHLRKILYYFSDKFTYRVNAGMISAMFFALIIVLPQNLSAQSDRWIFIGTTPNQIQNYFDKTSIKIKGEIVTVWEKSIYNDKSYQLIRTQYQCAEKKYRLVQVTMYTSQGKVIGQQNPTIWADVPPDSLAEKTYQLFCEADESLETESNLFGKLRVIARWVNVRKSPSLDGAIITKIKKGTVLILADSEPQNGWYRIYISETEKAWIHGNTVEFIDSQYLL